MTETGGRATGNSYSNAEHCCAHQYLMPHILRELANLNTEKRVFDLGCGNGSLGAALCAEGWDVTGIDISEGGIAEAKKEYPQLKLHQGSVYDDLAAQFGTFPVVTSFEVIEHLYHPGAFAKIMFALLEPGGTAIISTPYHGYWKNLALAASGKMDAHFTALWDGGHIKFFSERTLRKLLTKTGFEVERFLRVGRIPPLAKSMIAVAKKPAS